MSKPFEKLKACYEYCRTVTDFQPKVGLILGSGLGNYARNMKIICEIPYGDIPEFPVSTVEGHDGRFLFGYIGDVPAVVMKGRVHYYEGYSMEEVVLPTRLMKMLGIEVLFLTNASGGINRAFHVGDFMMITDQISSFAPSPLIGENVSELGAGEVVGGTVDVYSKVKEPVRVPFDADKINAMLGTDLSEEQMLAYFEKIDLGYDPETKEVIAPTFRHDLFRIADLAEEVARFYGYDNIPTTLPSGEATAGKLSFKLRIEQIARDIAEFCGFSEGMSYSFESPKVFDKLLIPADSELRRTVDIMNPLGEDYSVMRTVSLNGMLTSLATNYNRRNKNVRLYELGNIYLPKQLPLTELPEERMQFTLGMYGDGDFFTMKGVVEEFFEKIGMKQRETYDPNAGKPYLHPGRQANIIYDGKVVGYLGEVHPEVADTYGIGERAYVAVIDMPEILEYATFDRKYEGIAKYPAVSRDISMVVPKEILVGQIEDVIAAKGGKYLESFALFDLYEGAQIKDGYKSVAYTIVFRAKDRTLEEADVSAAMEKILKALEEMEIELRK